MMSAWLRPETGVLGEGVTDAHRTKLMYLVLLCAAYVMIRFSEEALVISA